MNILIPIGLAAAFLSPTLATLVSPAPALAQASKNAAPSQALQKEFEEFIAKFRAALKADDAVAVAGLSQLPFQEDKAVHDAAQFRAKIYRSNFKAPDRACLQRKKAAYDRDEAKNDNYYIVCSERIFIFTKTPAGFLLTDIGVND